MCVPISTSPSWYRIHCNSTGPRDEKGLLMTLMTYIPQSTTIEDMPWGFLHSVFFPRFLLHSQCIHCQQGFRDLNQFLLTLLTSRNEFYQDFYRGLLMILIYYACAKMPNIIARPFYSYWLGMRATYGLLDLMTQMLPKAEG